MPRPILFLALSLFMVLPTLAANNGGVGYVDMQKVLEQSKLGQRLQEQLRKEFEPKARQFAEDEKQIQTMQQSLERDKALMSKDQLAKKEKEIQALIADYQKKTMPIQQELMKVQQEKGREIVGPAREAVNAVAKQKKLGMVVERGLSGLLYLDESLEITAEVIKEIDAKTK
ncbi:OmpH family outer membrane protein [uncultured Thiocystis sp.]|jgi:outer membrane protein|uniref:OmpH family outer membrane protein n=1 Tax=uncultured Thiocystis sp. TaxID=1202134 RepID=UPI0025ED43AA|nr:OmpH family outer membrane protein [uncultured Thiocystis sp.]